MCCRYSLKQTLHHIHCYFVHWFDVAYKSLPVYRENILHSHRQNIRLVLFYETTANQSCLCIDHLLTMNGWIDFEVVCAAFPNVPRILSSLTKSLEFLENKRFY